ncbi:DotH/IcmK family type IV secretion protein [Streptomyces sp. NPDC059104]|uniref:DotH/IcmK family type IV secretion protein n=1 Tax=unclassified Streptomyces TaxID=2593676 RepID=UPI0035A36EC1
MAQHVTLMNVLEGVVPRRAVALRVSGGPAQAWLFDHHVYLRTRLTLVFPAWSATMSSPDGTRAYEMPRSPLLLGSADGRTVRLEIEGL